MRNRKLIEIACALNIQSMKHLALQLGISQEEIIAVTKNIETHFRVTELRQIKPDGKIKVRQIYLPSPRLKTILKAINIYLLRKIRLSEVVHGSRKGRSPMTNAAVHVGKKNLLGLDIENFFPSIKPYQVFNMFRRLNCSPTVAKHLTRLCTSDNHVPQGYATSPAIANLVFMPATERIYGLAKRQGIKLGTFVDDISISGNRCLNPFLKTIEKIIYVCGKYGPTAFIGKLMNRRGEVINSSDKLRRYLLGKVNFIKQINPERAEKLMLQFYNIRWG